jgi:hypothetical protein
LLPGIIASLGYDPPGLFTRLPAMSNQDDLAALTPAQ